MLAAVWHGSRDLRIEEMPEPTAGPGQVVIEVARNGICGSDLHTYVGAEHGGASMHVPGVILGHEFAGTVVQCGEGVEDLAIGSVVAVAPIEYCGSCFSCGHLHPNTCRSVAIYGGYREPLHGGLARYVAVSRRCVFEVYGELSGAEAALAEPIAVGVHATRQGPDLRGASVAVLGGGPIGLAILAAARACGAGHILVSEPSDRRRHAAQAMHADVAIDPADQSLPRVMRALTGDGADVVFDTTAVSAAFNEGLRALRPHGSMVSVAGWQEPATVDMGVAMAKEIDIRFSMTYQPEIDFPIALDLLRSRVADPEVLISDHIALTDVVELGLEALLADGSQHVKILVDPTR